MKTAAILISLLLAVNVSARNAADFFAQAPAEAVPLLTVNNRLDMLDYFHSGVETSTTNILDGKSRVVAEEPLKLLVEMSKSAVLQVAVLPNKGDTIVAFIETVSSPVNDSALTFYRAADWKRLPDPRLPGISDFISENNRKAATMADMPSIFFIGIDFDPNQQLFLVYNNSFENLPAGEQPDAALLMDSVQAYSYNGKKFVRVKEFTEKVKTPAVTDK